MRKSHEPSSASKKLLFREIRASSKLGWFKESVLNWGNWVLPGRCGAHECGAALHPATDALGQTLAAFAHAPALALCRVGTASTTCSAHQTPKLYIAQKFRIGKKNRKLELGSHEGLAGSQKVAKVHLPKRSSLESQGSLEIKKSRTLRVPELNISERSHLQSA